MVDNDLTRKRKAKAATMRRYRANKTKKKQIGRPEHNPTKGSRRMVSELKGFGFNLEEISGYLGLSISSLSKYYRDEIDNGVMSTNVKVLKNAFRKACSKDPRNNSVLIHWLKTRCGFVEDSQNDTAKVVSAVMEAMRPMNRDEWELEHGGK